jgi:Predicted Zn-dependent hydrolases of the beta-lactamase fold
VSPTSAADLLFLGHSTVLLEIGGLRLLTDPVLRPRLGPLRRVGTLAPDPARLEPDLVLISHAHHDHLDPESLRLLTGEPEIVVPTGLGGFLRGRGFRRVVEIAPGQTIVRGSSAVTATQARHSGRRMPFGPTAPAIGYGVKSAAVAVYFAGDTDLFDEMRTLGTVDLALLPVWGWGPRLGRGHLDPERAAQAAAMIRPRVAVPIHWGTLWPRGMARVGSDRLQAPPRDFAAAAARLAPDVSIVVVEPGERLSFGYPTDASPVADGGGAPNHRSS